MVTNRDKNSSAAADLRLMNMAPGCRSA